MNWKSPFAGQLLRGLFAIEPPGRRRPGTPVTETLPLANLGPRGLSSGSGWRLGWAIGKKKSILKKSAPVGHGIFVLARGIARDGLHLPARRERSSAGIMVRFNLSFRGSVDGGLLQPLFAAHHAHRNRWGFIPIRSPSSARVGRYFLRPVRVGIGQDRPRGFTPAFAWRSHPASNRHRSISSCPSLFIAILFWEGSWRAAMRCDVFGLWPAQHYYTGQRSCRMDLDFENACRCCAVAVRLNAVTLRLTRC